MDDSLESLPLRLKSFYTHSFRYQLLKRYIWSRDGVFDKIIAFEPDEDNYTAMAKRVNRLKEEWNFKSDAIQMFPYGVADKSMEMIFRSHGVCT